MTSSNLDMGAIVGGLSDGSVAIWDPSRIVSHNGDHALLFSRDLHNGSPVTCLEINPQKQSLLGSGGADGSVQVFNIEHPSRTEVYSGVTTSRHLNSEVTCLSWNRKVQHILATASNQGLAVIWDLKNKKEVISFKDPAGRARCSALSWNPDIPTQVLLAYNDDSNPCVQLWDMRNCTYPFKEFQEHSRGITAASFCDYDSNFLVSSGRDNKTVCWSLHTGQIEAYSDLSANSPAVKLDWSHHMPGFIAATSATGAVSIHSIAQRQTPHAAKFPPKWVKMPCGVTFGFGGKFATFSESDGSKVSLHVIPDDPSVIAEADRFESYLATDLRPLCVSKAHEATDEHDKLTWTMLSKMFDRSAIRRAVFDIFGIDASHVKDVAHKYLGREPAVTTISAPEHKIVDASPEKFGEHFGDSSNLGQEELDNLFDQLAKNSEMQQLQIPSNNVSRRSSPKAGDFFEDDSIRDVVDWSQGPESIIKQSMVIGDIALAVDCCFKSGRFADALFLAAGGGPDLLEHARAEYAKRQRDPFIRLLEYLFAHDLSKLVQKSDLNDWIETLAILATYAPDNEFPTLVDKLGDRLEKERFDIRSAVLCYLTSGSFDHTVRIWASMSGGQSSQSESLQNLVEKMSCLFTALRPNSPDAIFNHKMLQYAGLLANSGRILTAMRCLVLIPDSTESLILKDRIYNAAPNVMSQIVGSKPTFPFEATDVRPQPSYAAPPAIHTQPTGSRMPGQPAHNVAHNFNAPPSYGTTPGMQAPSMHHKQPQHQHQQHMPGAKSPPITAPSPGYPSTAPTFPTAHRVLPANSSPVPHQGTVGANVPGGFTPSGFSSVGTDQGFNRTPMAQPVGANYQPMTPGMAGSPGSSPMPPKPAGIPKASGIPARIGVAPPSPVQLAALQSIARNQTAYEAPQQYSAPPQYSTPSHGPSAAYPVSMPGARPVTGPPTSAGVSTAPHATANPVTSGLPVSWPVPNPVQQTLSSNPVTNVPKATSPPAPIGEPVSAAEISNVQRSFNRLLERCAVDGNRRKWDDTARKLGELYEKLAGGHISRESVDKLRQLTAAVDRDDFALASRLRTELSSTDWDRNRTWLFAMQLLLPK